MLEIWSDPRDASKKRNLIRVVSAMGRNREVRSPWYAAAADMSRPIQTVPSVRLSLVAHVADLDKRFSTGFSTCPALVGPVENPM